MGLFEKFKKKTGMGASAEPAAKSQSKDDHTHEHADEHKEAGKAKTSSILRPVISEKASTLTSQNVYAFFVPKGANKNIVAAAVKETYGIEPARVRIVRTKGKFVSNRTSSGFREDTKKAYVELPKGKSIVIHEKV